MNYLQVLKDIDDIDHLTLEKIEDSEHENIDHFSIRRMKSEKFALNEAVRLLNHIKMWYPETAEAVSSTDFSDMDSVFNTLRAVREIIFNLI